MLSPHLASYDPKSGKMVPVFTPHLMFYAPYLKNSDIGALPEHRYSHTRPWIFDEGKPYAYIIVVPDEEGKKH